MREHNKEIQRAVKARKNQKADQEMVHQRFE